MRVAWVEIPVLDMDRALAFYKAVFHLEPIRQITDDVRRVAVLISDNQTGLSLNQTHNFEPSSTGTLVYLDIEEDFTAHLGRVEAAGGTILQPTTPMDKTTVYAMIKDTEGNTIAMHFYRKPASI
jgi:predicted enzyme related to lactoylglutathione lyase